MPGHQYKSTNNNSQVIMSPPESIYLITLGHEYFNTAGSQKKKNFKTNFRKMMEVLKEEVNKSYKESKNKTTVK